ncbi:sensor histidine kinase [Urinicoccus massiliensis]|uniref:sensor histidine kinase n=1 Tax=Urinicoccus massiliensis TaxID=1723382 RepID=UPI000931EE72|nr:HAMP domain-containing sensor histidine kinase [Urinicoccus massiliensis]
MFNYILKRFKKIVLRILLLLFFLTCLLVTFLYLNYRLSYDYTNPNDVFSYVDKNKSTSYLNEKNKKFLEERDIWSIRLDRDGQVVESFHKPQEVKDQFDLTDVARFSRFYLADYPVFTYVVGDGLLLFAYPQHSLDKLPFNYYSYKNLIFNLSLVLVFLLLFLVFVYILYRVDIKDLLKNILPLQRAIDSLYEDDYERLDEGGELGDLALSINQANEKYKNLKEAQDKWIRGLSHDVRTPLAKISWEVSKENKEDLDTKNIQDQVLKISTILEGLNLTLSLSKLDRESFTEENPLKVIRKLIVDKLNENPTREIIFESKINNPNLRIKMDPNLFYRMLENILKNALSYTGGQIRVTISDPENKLIIRISDQGKGISEDVLEKITREDLTNVTKHGLGILISKQIAQLHGGTLAIKNQDPGLQVSFLFNHVH